MVAWRNIDKTALEPANLTASHQVLAGLKDRVAGIESQSSAAAGAEMLSTGVAEIDRALPWGGLPTAGLHEIAGWRETDFALALIVRLLARDGETRPVFWCQPEDGARERGRLYGPGLAARGLDPSRLIFVTTRRDKEALWAMEEALAAGAAAGAVGEIPALGMTETRRLQLAAAKGGSMGLILRGPVGDRATSAAITRWRAEPVEHTKSAPGSIFPSPLRGEGQGGGEFGEAEIMALSEQEAFGFTPHRPPAAPTSPSRGEERASRRRISAGFSLSLWRARGGRPAQWTVEQDAETFHLALAAALADRPALAG